ncbi:response regulator [Paenibacillus algorifonticola]|uniref:response regulator n=1 Tax=Paenibacillus algorifonticola TaxID=684063 RepID=UPI003D2895FC
MIKVLIVDDEALVRIGIKTIIPWEELGLELIGEAENGKKALEMAREHVPDIILTDIKMPIMTGIELLKALKREDHPAKFIILSAHDDLEFVKEAMKNGAEDYILKLELESEQLIGILKELKTLILTSSSEQVYFSTARPAYHAPLHKEKLFKDMLLGIVKTQSEILHQLEANRLTFPDEQLVCLIIEVDDASIYLKYGESPHLLDYSVLNILEEVLSSYAYGHVISLQLQQFIAVLSLRPKGDARSSEGLEELMANIRITLRKYLSTSVSIGISEIYDGYERLQQAYREAKEAVRFAFIYPRGTNVYYRDICLLSSQETDDLSAEMKSLEKAFIDGEMDDIQQALERLTEGISRNHKLTKELLMGISFTIFYLFQSFVENYQLSEKEILTKDMYDRISTMSMKVDFIEWINQLNDRMTRQLMENYESLRVYLTKQFINKHYKGELSLEKVADYLQLSPAYLSNLFKKETGQNFIDYVTEVKIGRAKFLLKTTDLKIAEIAREVGYGDEYYFSKVFKKNVGESPLKYR